jgi:hypothetical protein
VSIGTAKSRAIPDLCDLFDSTSVTGVVLIVNRLCCSFDYLFLDEGERVLRAVAQLAVKLSTQAFYNSFGVS